MADDIVERLRDDDGPPWCWECGYYGCQDENHDDVPCRHFGHDEWECTNNKKCVCDCHRWEGIVLQAADEIERLRNELQIVTVHLTHVNETNLHIIDGLREQLEEFRRG